MGKREACIKFSNLDVKKGRVTLKLRMRLVFYARDKAFSRGSGKGNKLTSGKNKNDRSLPASNVVLTASVVHHTKK